MIVKKGDYIETKIGGVYGEVLNIDREKEQYTLNYLQTVR